MRNLFRPRWGKSLAGSSALILGIVAAAGVASAGTDVGNGMPADIAWRQNARLNANIQSGVVNGEAAFANAGVTTVEFALPSGNFTEILPSQPNSVYSGLVTGYFKLSRVAGTSIDLFCGDISLAGLENGGWPVSQSVLINEEFICPDLEIRHNHDGFGRGPQGFLTVQWKVLDITDEITNLGF